MPKHISNDLQSLMRMEIILLSILLVKFRVPFVASPGTPPPHSLKGRHHHAWFLFNNSNLKVIFGHKEGFGPKSTIQKKSILTLCGRKTAQFW